MSENLVEGIQRLVKHVREELMPAYREIGPAGTFGLAMITQAADEGDAAIASGDVVRMLAAFKALEGCQ